MDIDNKESLDFTQPNSRIKEAEILWQCINETVMTIFPKLEYAVNDNDLRLFLDFMLRRTGNLTSVLVPPVGRDPNDELLIRQHTTFTIWLFGVMFYVIGSPLSEEVLKNSIDLQAHMLVVLHHYNVRTIDKIISEYDTIFQEISAFVEQSNSDENGLLVSKFETERDIIENLDLAHFPVTITASKVSMVQISIMKIILKAGVHVWNENTLWDKILEIFLKSIPEAKIIALEVAMCMYNNHMLDDEKWMAVQHYAMEITESLPIWNSSLDLSLETLSLFDKALIEFVNNLDSSALAIKICFEVVEQICNKFIQSKILEEIVCRKINDYVLKDPNFRIPNQTQVYLEYFNNCLKFAQVIVSTLFNEVKTAVAHNQIIDILTISDLWRSLKELMVVSMEHANFETVLHILQSTRTLEALLKQEDIKVQLYGDNLDDMTNKFVENLNSNAHSNTTRNTIFQCLIETMAHEEADRSKIQKILALPFMAQKNSPSGLVKEPFASFVQNLDTSTRISCVEVFCECGEENLALGIIQKCISKDDFESKAAYLLSSVILLQRNVSFEKFDQYVLKPGYQAENPKVHEALVELLSWIVCFLSDSAKIRRESFSSLKWTVSCEDCINEISNSRKVPENVDQLLKPYFHLLASDFVNVRLKFSQKFREFSNHTDSFNSNSIAGLAFPYIREKNPEISKNASLTFGCLFRNKLEFYHNHSLTFNTEADVPEELDDYVDMLIKEISTGLITNLDSDACEPTLHGFILAATKNVLLVPLHITEHRLLNVFLFTMMHPNTSIANVTEAAECYKEIAEFYAVSAKMLYIRHRLDFLKLMMKRVLNNYMDYKLNIATSLHKVAKCLGYQGSRNFVTKEGPRAISFLLSLLVSSPQALPLITDLADLWKVEEHEIIADHFQYICCHGFLQVPDDDLPDYFNVVSTISKMKLPDLMEISSLPLQNELLVYFHENPEKVASFIGMTTGADFEYMDQLTEYLAPKMHQVLVALNSHLNPRYHDEYTQKSALASLTIFLQIMKPENLTPLKYKILATLQTSLGFTRPGFRKLAYEAWYFFLHSIPAADLGPLLPTICVSMIPLFECYPQKANEMLEFLFIENYDAISNYISELFFINDLNVSQNISDAVNAHIIQARPSGVRANLQVWLRRIKHETAEVRLKALQHMKKFLSDHRSELNDMILSDSNVHPLIVELLDTLLNGCQDSNDTIRLAYGECLGELGAVEPSLFPRRIVSRADSKFIASTNEEFAFGLLNELVRAFQMQNSTQDLDCFSLAIQVVLQSYEITPVGKNQHLWRNLPSTTQDMIHPFLTSCYRPTSSFKDFPHPIYGSDSGLTFENWAYNWICSISNNIKDQTFSHVLNASCPALKRDMKILVFCLPYALLHIIIYGSEEEKKILVEEILTVIDVRKEPTLDQELFNYYPLQRECDERINDTRISDEAKRVRCSQVVFSILDYLQRYLREQKSKRDAAYKAVENFCDKLDDLVVVTGCYQSHEYHRALMYLEQHMMKTNKGLSESTEGDLLAKIYAQLDEPDGVSGILATQDQFPTLQQLVLAHEVSSQLQDAAMCYEKLAQKEAGPKYSQGVIQCYFGLNQPFTAMNLIKGILESEPELEPILTDPEPFWRLSNYTGLDNKSENSVKTTLLEDLKRGIRPNLEPVKMKLLSLMGVGSNPGAYQQSYPYIMKLHVLNEFEKAVSLMMTDIDKVPCIFPEWEKRGQLVRASRGVEFVLSMRRAALDLAVALEKDVKGSQSSVLKEEIGKIWLKSSRIARKAGLHQQAYIYILSASDSCPPQELYIEQAQLHWQKGNQEEAFTTLKRCLSSFFQPAIHYKQMSSDYCTEERRQCAKAKLLFAKYNAETVNVGAEANIQNYKEAIDVWRAWEKSMLAYAQFLESVVDRMTDEERDSKGRDFQTHMISYYGKSLQYGCKYIHQSMPRMLTIWLDFASRAQSDNQRGRTDCLEKMTKIIEVFLSRLPTFMWLTAFSQLVSRICHPSREVQQAVCSILVKLILAYPQQCLWMMASVFNSSYPVRKRRCQEIMSSADLRTPQMMKLVSDFNKLSEKLIELSNKATPDNVTTTFVSSLSKGLSRLLASPDFSQIMMPTTTFRKVHLPTKSSIGHHNPFPLNWIHIIGIEDEVAVMQSLQKPKRITLKGSDGKKYLFMCKPKDDLRRDFRFMEFNDIVNKCLQKDPDSRQRRLYIRTYSVAPLNEECGLIEWVSNLERFRQIVLDIYKQKGILTSGKELRTMICNLKDPLEKKRQVFLEKLIPKHPPVLGEWFRLSFPDPYGWYEARTAYIRTTAVMSMVGYILGLGDRHGENINFDTKRGDCVHVDFNCLFNRGELLDWPEKVPFRLTHNMVEAMGPLKCEGPFRLSCQTTMRVLRQQSSTLISVLKPFVYDPLVTWNRNQPGETAEKTNEKAVEHIKNIERRLEGSITTQKMKLFSLNLSVEGQTNQLILDATNVDNLCQMYIGWGAYL